MLHRRYKQKTDPARSERSTNGKIICWRTPSALDEGSGELPLYRSATCDAVVLYDCVEQPSELPSLDGGKAREKTHATPLTDAATTGRAPMTNATSPRTRLPTYSTTLELRFCLRLEGARHVPTESHPSTARSGGLLWRCAIPGTRDATCDCHSATAIPVCHPGRTLGQVVPPTASAAANPTELTR